MYKAFYRLTGDPFRLSPDHAFCYRYPSFAKGRAYMQYALQAAEGFVVVTGAPGMGKTTLINDLLSDYGPSDYLVATMVNTMLEADDILRSAAYEFGVSAEGLDTATLLQRLKQLFTQCHHDRRPPLLVVDEAQNLSFNALEELRMLTNLQYEGKPLLQIFLVGQEGLRDKLQDPRLEQLRQRVTAAAHLHPLNQEQTAAYILHRLKVVGWANNPRIRASVLPVIELACQGVPRRINQFCSRLLLHGAVEEKSDLNGQDARLVFEELADERLSSAPAGSSAMLESEFLASAEPAPEEDRAAEVEQEPVFASAENLLRDQEKTVMPPPGKAPSDAKGGSDMPSVEEAFGSYPERRAPAARTHLRDPEFDGQGTTVGGEPGPADYAGPASHRRPESYPGPESRSGLEPYPGPESYPRRPPRASRRPLFGYFVLVFALIGAGVYAWYQYDRRDPLELFSRQLGDHVPPPPEAGTDEGSARSNQGDAPPASDAIGGRRR